MYPVTEDRHGGTEHRWRLVQLRVGPAEPYEHSGVTWRVVGWARKYNDVAFFRVGEPEGRVVFKLKDMGLDLSAHLAFCRGDMPAAVYADWLEENVRDFPAVGLALLRGWLSEKEGRISYKGEGDE